MLEDQPILYQNETRTVFLLDVPTSIAAAQGAAAPLKIQLRSVAPLRQPHQIHNEPHASKHAKVKRNTTDAPLHAEYVSIIVRALDEIKRHQQKRDWCLPRSVVGLDPHDSRDSLGTVSFPKSNFDSDQVSSEGDPGCTIREPSDNSWDAVTSLLRNISSDMSPVTDGIRSTPAHLSIPGRGEDSHGSTQTVQQSFYINNTDTIEMLTLEQNTNRAPPVLRQFLIPPRSVFLLGDCTDSTALRAAVRKQDGDGQSRRFHFVLIDPPWPNHSAKRKHAYRRPQSLRDIRRLLLGMDLDSHIAPNGFIGVWITNNPAIRSLVLDPGGLFDAFNVSLVEEWIWVKTTASGEPVSDLESLWRKPYEVLLIGKAPESSLMIAQPCESIVRRVIASVPDYHSRKPCLKLLLESLLLDHDGTYRALEVFARNLVSGWWSWGDEVLKFNWKGAYAGS